MSSTVRDTNTRGHPGTRLNFTRSVSSFVVQTPEEAKRQQIGTGKSVYGESVASVSVVSVSVVSVSVVNVSVVAAQDTRYLVRNRKYSPS